MGLRADCLALLAVVSAASLGCGADEGPRKTYTPDALRDMVERGAYPAQLEPTVQERSMQFDECVRTVREVAGAVEPEYPTEIVVDTNILRVEKIWTNDAAITASCSAPDRKLVITAASYQ